MEIRPVTKVKTAEQAIEYALEAYKTETRSDPKRVTSLRVSSFPFCATKWWLALPVSLNGVRSSNFMNAFFTDVGTQVHTTIQRSLRKSPLVVRDWVCTKCKHRHEYQTVPSVCAGCKSSKISFLGEENEVRAGVIVGHIDDSFLLADDFIDLTDYKTTTSAKIKTKGALPNLENVRQIEAYAAIKKRQGVKIKSWTLVYISRDNGARKYVRSDEFYGHAFEVEYPKILKRLKAYVRDYKDISKASELEEVLDVASRRRLTSVKEDAEGLCEHCSFKSVCVSEKRLRVAAERVITLMKKQLPIRRI